MLFPQRSVSTKSVSLCVDYRVDLSFPLIKIAPRHHISSLLTITSPVLANLGEMLLIRAEYYNTRY